MTIVDPLSSVYPDLAHRMQRVYANMQIVRQMSMRACQGMRTYEEQEADWNQGRTTSGAIITYARAGESFHNFGCAVDSCFTGSDPFLDKLTKSGFYWAEYGRFVLAQGLVWGGGFSHPDRPHAQITYGLTLTDIQEIYADGGVPAVWAAFDRVRGISSS